MKQTTIRAIFRIFAFFAVLAVVIYFLSYMLKPHVDNLENIAGFYGEKHNSVDVVCIGGSAAFVYYAPVYAWEHYGIVAYDFAANTVEAELYRYMIDEVLQYQKPRLIIIDARAFQYRDAENEDSQPPTQTAYRNVLTGMRFSGNKLRFIHENVKKYLHDDPVSYYFDIIKYHTNHQFDMDNFKMALGQYRSPYRGFATVPRYQSIVQSDFVTEELKPVSAETETILRDLLQFLDSREDIEFLFVVSPYNEKKEHKAIFRYVQEIIEEAGYPFLDCNEYTEQMELNYAEDFYDERHVNIFGAEKYTTYLSEYILERYAIPDHREDSRYAYMNADLDKWHAFTEKTKKAILALKP